MNELHDLVRVAKAIEHMRHGRKQQMLDEYSLVQSPMTLPDWDDVELDLQIEVYQQVHEQLIKEGYREQS